VRPLAGECGRGRAARNLKTFPQLLCLAAILCLPLQGANTQRPPAQPANGPSVRSVENAGLLFTDNPAGVSGTDAGYSLPMGKQTLWLFGDVFLLDPKAPAKPFLGSLSNCALLVPAGRGAAPLHTYRFLTDPATGLARQVLPSAPGEGKEVRYWPFGGWYSERERRVYLYYARVRTTGQGPLDFRTEGYGLAVADTSVPEKLEFRTLPGAGGRPFWWTTGPGESIFGSAVIHTSRNGDGYLYVAGLQSRDGRRVGKLARVPTDKIADPAAYTYYAGGTDEPAWSPDVRKAADVAGLADFPTELSVSYNPYLRGYLAVHSVGLSGRVRLSLAEVPWGPYRSVGEIATPRRTLSKGFCYAGKEHPELAQEGGRVIYVTYVDSERYWLQLLKVTLQK
jgi:hypothetical protein